MSGATAFYAPLSAVLIGEGPILVLAYGMDSRTFLIVKPDGTVATVDCNNVIVDWRFNWQRQIWEDVAGLPDDGTEESLDEATDHGSEAVPGHLPDIDGPSGGDPGDGEDGTTGGLDTGQEEPK